MDFDPADYTRKEADERLDELVRLDILRGWTVRSSKFVVGYWDDDATDPVEVVLSWPQLRAYLCGVDAGMAWTLRVARRVQAEKAASA